MTAKNENNTKISTAWLLNVTETFSIAVGASSLAEYVLSETLYPVPGAVAYCSEVLFYHGNFVPVIDFNQLLNNEAISSEHIVVAAYTNPDLKTTEYIAIKTIDPSEKIEAPDSSQCDWPNDYPALLEPIVLSLFNHDNKVVSILNLADMCNHGYAEFVSSMRVYTQ